MRRLCFHNHLLQLLPLEHVLGESGFILLASLVILDEKHADKEVKEEERADHDEDDEEGRVRCANLLLRTIVFLGVHLNI